MFPLLISILVLTPFCSYQFTFAYKIEDKFNGDTVNITYLLYTRNNPNVGQILTKYDIESISLSNFLIDKPLKVSVHGRNSIGEDDFNLLIKDEFLDLFDINIILLDWSDPGSGEYDEVVARVPAVGKELASFINWLNELGVLNDDVHLIGRSQGAHLVGIAGRHCNKSINYITALDPPGNLWDNTTERLTRHDGDYVEVIHSNGGEIGLLDPVGDTDFYPNGGTHMPGCEIIDSTCNHLRSFEYYADSIDHNGFMANQCASYEEILNNNCSNLSRLHMGGAKPKKSSGIFYLETNADKPYYRG